MKQNPWGYSIFDFSRDGVRDGDLNRPTHLLRFIDIEDRRDRIHQGLVSNWYRPILHGSPKNVVGIPNCEIGLAGASLDRGAVCMVGVKSF